MKLLNALAYEAAFGAVHLAKLSDLSVRWHGLGMLQLEVSHALRVHVWSARLMKLPRESFRRVHDHRFSIESVVVHGFVVDQPWRVVQMDMTGKLMPMAQVVSVHAIQHAKIQTGAHDASFLYKAHAAPTRADKIEKGEHYHIPRREFHTSYPPPEGVAVTVIHRFDFDNEPARVLDMHDVEETLTGIHSPWREDEGALVKDVLREAYEALRK